MTIEYVGELILVVLIAVWIVHRKPRVERPRQPKTAEPTTRSNWRRRARWFAIWWTLPLG